MKQGVLLKEKNFETKDLMPTALLGIMKISLFCWLRPKPFKSQTRLIKVDSSWLFRPFNYLSCFILQISFLCFLFKDCLLVPPIKPRLHGIKRPLIMLSHPHLKQDAHSVLQKGFFRLFKGHMSC